MWGREDKCTQGCGKKNLKERENFEDLDIDEGYYIRC